MISSHTHPYTTLFILIFHKAPFSIPTLIEQIFRFLYLRCHFISIFWTKERILFANTLHPPPTPLPTPLLTSHFPGFSSNVFLKRPFSLTFGNLDSSSASAHSLRTFFLAHVYLSLPANTGHSLRSVYPCVMCFFSANTESTRLTPVSW